MIVMMKSSTGAEWTFFATAGDKVFLVETRLPQPQREAEAVQDMIRECRWMFGDRRIIFLNRDHRWVEVLHDGTGQIKDFEKYDGPVPAHRQEEGHE